MKAVRVLILLGIVFWCTGFFAAPVAGYDMVVRAHTTR